MHTQIASKIATLTVALIVNGFITAGVAVLFDGQSHQPLSVIASDRAATPSTHAAT
ncbi:MAG TPA: hypothetical protein VNZ53_12210 [Steroidobacteraceae bacterium]|jgi:hypothetical protein|nr:hypothetical protein [Steroidobacteraceae bacterium]